MQLTLVRICLFLGTVLGLVGCSPVVESTSEPRIQSLEWRIDTGGKDTLADAQKASDWQPMPQLKSWGFGAETIWVRMNLRAADKGDEEPWLLSVRPNFLDYLTLYDPASNVVLRSGRAVAPSADELASIFFTFEIPALQHERTIFLQLRSISSRLVDVEVLPQAQTNKKNLYQGWLIGFLGAVAWVLALSAFGQWFMAREKVMLAFAAKQTFATLWVFFNFGFGRVVFGPSLPEGFLTVLTSAISIWTIFTLFWFFSILLEEYQPSVASYRVYRFIISLLPPFPALLYLVPGSLIMFTANIVILILIFLLLLVATSIRSNQPNLLIPRAVLIVYLLIYSIPICVPTLMHIGLIEARSTLFYGLLTHVVLDGFVMFALLQFRARAMREQQYQIAMDLQRSQQEAEEKQRHLKEQGQLFGLLAHQMKTPLSTLSMLMEVGPLKPDLMKRTIKDINSTIDRCVQTGQLAEEGLRAESELVDAVALSRNYVALCRFPDRVDWTASIETCVFSTDPQMLAIVMGNLLDNACKFATPESRIILNLNSAIQDGKAGWRWEFINQVRPGDFPDADRLFEKYYRSASVRRVAGSGLGLFLVRGLVVLMQGTINYRPQGDRVAFSLWLPEKLDRG